MSEPRYGTGNVEPRPCRVCGATVDHIESVGLYGSGPVWSSTPHNAPCGLPCMGGGARGRDGFAAYREGRMHGLRGWPPGVHPRTDWDEGGPYDGAPDRPCPACTGQPPMPLADARRSP